jgi:hypothetical protein
MAALLRSRETRCWVDCQRIAEGSKNKNDMQGGAVWEDPSLPPAELAKRREINQSLHASSFAHAARGGDIGNKRHKMQKMHKSHKVAARDLLASLASRLPLSGYGEGAGLEEGGGAGPWHNVVRDLVKANKSEHWDATDAAQYLASRKRRHEWDLPDVGKYAKAPKKKKAKKATTQATAARHAAQAAQLAEEAADHAEQAAESFPAPLLRRSGRANKGKAGFLPLLLPLAAKALFGRGLPADAPAEPEHSGEGGFLGSLLMSAAAPLLGSVLSRFVGRGLPAEGGAAGEWHKVVQHLVAQNRKEGWTAADAAQYVSANRGEFGLPPVRGPGSKRRAKAGPLDKRRANPEAAARLRAYNEALARVRAEHGLTQAEGRKFLREHSA